VLLPLFHCMRCALRCEWPALTVDQPALARCHASSSTLADDAARALLLWLDKQLLIIVFTAGQTEQQMFDQE
jgi:hypothetical protein